MEGLIRASVCLIFAGMTSTLFGCGELPSSQKSQLTAVSVSDVHTVAGKWEGLVKESPSPPLRYGDDWVTLTIRENGETGAGTFEFANYRTIGVFSGSGSLTLNNGALESESENGRTTYTLHQRGDERVLIVEGQDKKGIRYHVELTRAK